MRAFETNGKVKLSMIQDSRKYYSFVLSSHIDNGLVFKIQGATVRLEVLQHALDFLHGDDFAFFVSVLVCIATGLRQSMIFAYITLCMTCKLSHLVFIQLISAYYVSNTCSEIFFCSFQQDLEAAIRVP